MLWRNRKSSYLSKSSSLRNIARDGHVYGFEISIRSLDQNRGFVLPSLLGVNRASTFTGFCSKHDNLIFSPLEDRPFTGSKEQCFLLGYRALAREYFTKLSAKSLSDIHRQGDRGKPPEQQRIYQDHVSALLSGVEAGVQDAIYQKKFF